MYFLMETKSRNLCKQSIPVLTGSKIPHETKVKRYNVKKFSLWSRWNICKPRFSLAVYLTAAHVVKRLLFMVVEGRDRKNEKMFRPDRQYCSSFIFPMKDFSQKAN